MFQLIFGDRKKAGDHRAAQRGARNVERREIEALLQDELTGLPPLSA